MSISILLLLLFKLAEKMWSGDDFELPTENRFIADRVGEMTRDGFQMAGKRRRTNTGQSDSEHRSVFSLSNGEDKLNIIFDELVHIRKSQDNMYRGMLSFQNSFMNIGEKITQVIQTTNRNTDMLKTLAYKSIDIEARSRRNNLIFWGLVENRNENCFALIRQFIKNELDLDADNMYLARAHRLGPVKKFVGLRKRPLIVNFRDYCDTQSIMSNAHLLRGTPFSVDQDLPKEISAARKLLWAEIKSIKRSKPSAKCQIIYPAKLMVDGKVVRDEFPDWSEAMKGSRLGDFSHIEERVFTRDTHEPIQIPAMHRDSVNGPSAGPSSADMSLTVNSASCSRATPPPDLDVTLPPHENDISDMDYSQSLISLKDNPEKENDLPHITVPNPSSSNNSHSQPPHLLFRPFNSENEQNVNKSKTKTSNPEFPRRGEREARPKERGSRRVQSLSLPRLKTGTRKSVKSKTINSAANSPSLGLTTKETVTAQGVINRDNEDTNDSNRPEPSIRDNNNGYS